LGNLRKNEELYAVKVFRVRPDVWSIADIPRLQKFT
jgi:hypothetical protein